MDTPEGLPSSPIEGLRYSDDDLWVESEGAQRRVGVTDYAQDQLGEVVYLELPGPGEPITTGKPFGVIESAKAVIDLISPLTGVVRERNEATLADPTLVNEHPYTAGWLISAEPSEPLSSTLMTAKTYHALRAE